MLQKIAITVHLDKLFKNRLFRIFEEYGVVRSFFFSFTIIFVPVYVLCTVNRLYGLENECNFSTMCNLIIKTTGTCIYSII